MRLAPALFALVGCVHAPATSRTAAALGVPTIVCDGVADDRLAIQTALDVGDLALPAGVCLVSGTLHVGPGRTIRGAGRDVTTLMLAAGAPLSTQLLWIEDAPGVTIQDITLDGNRALQGPPNGAGFQRHGAFIKHSPGFAARRVTAQHFAGDGFYLYNGSDHSTLSDVAAVDNDRDGVTLGGAVGFVSAMASTFSRNGQSGWHSEGSGNNNDVALTGCTFDGNAGFAITMSGVGVGPTAHNYRWTVVGNEVNGPVMVTWADDVTYLRNHGTNLSIWPSVSVVRSCDRVRIEDNTLTATGLATMASQEISIVSIMGATGQSPSNVIVSRNTLTTVHPQFGVSVVSVRDAMIEDNVLVGSLEGIGAHGSGAAGVFVRTIRVDEPTKSVVIQRNTISGFGEYAVELGGNGSAKIQRVVISGNTFAQPVYLDDGLHEALDVSVSGAVVDHPPSGALTAADGQRWVMP